jgi:hypothetical protein
LADNFSVEAEFQVKENRFLVIREFMTTGMCACLMHVINSLVYAEISQRIPIVHWGTSSAYHETTPEQYNTNPENVFEHYFEPVSDYSITEILGKGYRYFPSIWTDSTILNEQFPQSAPLPHKLLFPGSDADILVSYSKQRIEDLQRSIPLDHELSDLTIEELRYFFFGKFIRLRQNLKQLIEKFYDGNMRGRNVIGVHVRKTDKKSEQVSPYTWRFMRAVETLLSTNRDAKVFVATDCERTLNKFACRFPNRVIFTDSIRSSDSTALHLSGDNKRLKGEQILIDIYLLSRCNHFIGSLATSISFVVLFMLTDPALSKSWSTIIKPSFLERAGWHLTTSLPKRIKMFFQPIKRKLKQALNHP